MIFKNFSKKTLLIYLMLYGLMMPNYNLFLFYQTPQFSIEANLKGCDYPSNPKWRNPYYLEKM